MKSEYGKKYKGQAKKSSYGLAIAQAYRSAEVATLIQNKQIQKGIHALTIVF